MDGADDAQAQDLAKLEAELAQAANDDDQASPATLPALNEGADGIDHDAMANREIFYLKRMDKFAQTIVDTLTNINPNDMANLIEEVILLLKSLGKVMKIAFSGK